MRADFHVLLDACVMANHGVCDLLLCLAERPRLFVPHWSNSIMEEVSRTHREKLGWPDHLAAHYQAETARCFPEATVSGYEAFLAVAGNDEKDRHVLAAAICGGCSVILTFNLKHFRSEHLLPHGITAVHPDDYLVTLHELEPHQVVAVLGEIAGRRRMETEDVLIRLGSVVPKFSSIVLQDLSK